MRIRRMKLVNFRGVQEREILLGDGVTIVEGPNETGKSTFQDALDLLFRRKDNASAAEVLDAIPHGQDVGPEVEAEIETGRYAFVFRKRFRRRAETVLQIVRPAPESLVGDRAHDRANAILDETLDKHLWERLRVKQADKLAPAAVGNAPTLMTALDELSGVGGQELADGGLVPRVEGIYKRYFTLNRGSETGELQKARVEAEKAKADDEVARAQLGELEEQIEKYERLQQEVTRLEEQGSAAKVEGSRRAEALRAFESVRQRVDKAQTAHALAETAQTKARGAAQARTALKDQAAEAAKALESAKTQHAELTAAFTRVKSAYNDAESAVKGAEREEREAGANLTAARNRVEYLDARERRARLAERIERIEALQRQIDEADAAVRANPVDDALIGRVRQADRVRREAAAALQAGAPEVAIDALQSIETRVNEETVGLSAGDHRDFHAAEELRFELPDVLRLRVRPGASLADLQSARAETEKEIERLLHECGADSVERAERRARERAQVREDSKTAHAETRALLGGEDLPHLRTELAEVDSRMAALSEGLEEPDDLDKTAAVSACEQAGAQFDQVSNRFREARAAFSGLSEPYGREKERLEQAGRSLEAARVGDRNATAALTEARQRADDESLGAGLTEAERQLEEASAALTAERRALEAYDEESIRTLATNSRKVAGDAERKLNDARQLFAGVRSLVEVGREKGLFERAQDARDRASVCAENLARVEARANGVKRLREVLSQCQQQAYEKHRAPFRERVEKLSRLAFGKDVQIELAENLTVSRRTMDGVTLEFRQLSGGAQEQLGLASRLATAMLLGDDGGPLMLDDTLGHSDPERLRGLGAMLGAAAGQAQVVIFTCQPDRFAHVGGATTVRF